MQLVTMHLPFVGINANPSYCSMGGRYRIIDPFFSGSMIKLALEIEAYRHDNMSQSISLILGNMGYKKVKAKTLSQLFTPILSGERDVSAISSTSSLGRFLREFFLRKKAFDIIYHHLTDVSETVLEDVAFPLDGKLRKEVEEEALVFLSNQAHIKRSENSSNQSHDDDPSLFYQAKEKLYSLGNQITSIFAYANTKFLSFPMASAESSIPSAETCENDLLSEDCKLSFEHLNEILTLVESHIKVAEKKNCIRILGYAGAGKSTWINYLFSEKCRINPEDGLRCDLEIANTGQGLHSVTEYIHTYPIQNITGFAEDTVIIDFPGLLGKGGDRLVNFIQSIMTAKSIIRIGEVANSVIDVIIIDDPTLEMKAGLSDLTEALSLKEKATNRMLIITKAPTSDQKIYTKRGVSPHREGFKKALLESGIDSTLASHLILYDVEDNDFPLNSTSHLGGGSDKKATIAALFKLQNLAINQIKHSNAKPLSVMTIESLLTRTISEDLLKIKEILQEALTKVERNRRREIFERVRNLLRIDYPPFSEMVNRLLEEINWDGIENESQTRFQEMLPLGHSTSFLHHFESEVLAFKKNVLAIEKFNQTSFIHVYIHSLLKEQNIHEDLGKSKVFSLIHQEFPHFLPILKNKIFFELDAIRATIQESSLTCGFYKDEESIGLKKLVNILKLDIGVCEFEELTTFIKLIDELSKNLSEIQEQFPIQKYKIIDEKLKAIRNALLDISTMVIFYIYYKFSQKRKQTLLQSGRILTWQMWDKPLMHFIRDSENRSIKNLIRSKYNKWKLKDGNLKPSGDIEDQSKENILVEDKSYCLLRHVNLIENTHKVGMGLLVAITLIRTLNAGNLIEKCIYKCGGGALLNFLDRTSLSFLKSLNLVSLVNNYKGETIIHDACLAAQKIALHSGTILLKKG